MTKNKWILTRAQVSKLIHALHAKEHAELMARFDLGARRHRGRPLDLRSRKWDVQGHEERLDLRMYLDVFLPEYLRRLMLSPMYFKVTSRKASVVRMRLRRPRRRKASR